MKEALELIEQAIEKATLDKVKWRLQDIQLHSEYVEPGYTTPDNGIATGDWNKVDEDTTLPELSESLEALGVGIEWLDEWTTCHDCNGLVRVVGNSYHWKPSYHIFRCGTLRCHKCIKQDVEAYLTDLEGSYTQPVTFPVDLHSHGYRKLNDYENGFYEGQDASPQRIADALKRQDIKRFVLSLDKNSQFETHFSVWVREEE